MFIDYAGVVLVEFKKPHLNVLLIQYKNTTTWDFPHINLKDTETEEQGAIRSCNELLGHQPSLLPNYQILDEKGGIYFVAKSSPFKAQKHPSIDKFAWFKLSYAKQKLNNPLKTRIMAQAIGKITNTNPDRWITKF